MVGEACKALLEPEFEVVGIVSDGHALLRAVNTFGPDVAIVDLSMPLLNGLDACEQISRKHPAVKLVILTMTLDPEVAAEAFRRGASGYVVKHSSADELTVAVRRVLRGESYLSPLLTKETVKFLLVSGVKYQSEKQLSIRQREILQLLAEGKSMKEIAFLLHIQPGTVAFHKYKIMELLTVKSNAQLVEYALTHHMIG